MERLESGNAVLQTIHASEGGRALKLLQQRQKRQQELENAKTSIENETTKRKLFGIDAKYKGSTTEALEEAFKQETVGLVSAQEFREKRKRLNELLEEKEKKKSEVPVEKRVCKSRVERRVLSFAEEEEGDEEEVPTAATEVGSSCQRVAVDGETGSSSDIGNTSGEAEPWRGEAVANRKGKSKSFFRCLGKDPSVDTEFLHDREREAKRALERQELIREYIEGEERSKAEVLEVTYSYWDGSGHRRVARVPKGASVGEFLKECHKALEREFSELRGVSVDNLMYIKEDLILPHGVSFYDLIKNKAKGKSGPLFHFDVHEDIRMFNDARIEKDESHAGKIVDRKWYERNKHIFPASRWELYDPNKTFEKYTIHGHKDFSSEIQNAQTT